MGCVVQEMLEAGRTLSILSLRGSLERFSGPGSVLPCFSVCCTCLRGPEPSRKLELPILGLSQKWRRLPHSCVTVVGGEAQDSEGLPGGQE